MGIKVVLCDDHQIIREGLRSLLEKQTDMAVIGEGANGLDAIRLVRDKKPDVLVLDISMPEMNGITAARRAFQEYPRLKILALSVHSDQHFVTEMLEAGASGYMLKDSAFSELAAAIRTIMSGGLFISPRIANNVLEQFAKRAAPVNRKKKARKVELSPRESEILQMIAEGKSSKDIAQISNISVKTVETHRLHIMTKIGAHNVASLTKYAIREGLTSLEE
ncbi:MAG: response regulator transcription factor [bacterium]